MNKNILFIIIFIILLIQGCTIKQNDLIQGYTKCRNYRGLKEIKSFPVVFYECNRGDIFEYEENYKISNDFGKCRVCNININKTDWSYCPNCGTKIRTKY